MIYSFKREIQRLIPDKLYLKIMYRRCTGKNLNLKNPHTFNEKLQWLKIYDRNTDYTKMVDKYEVKKYVAEKIGAEYIIPTLGVWDCFDDIDFDTLPKQFVLKTTHDSGGVVICRDKDNFDYENAKIKLSNSLQRNFYYLFREWPYKNVKPRIIAEKYLSDIDDENSTILDYKVFNFNGVPKAIQVDMDRFTNHTRNIYDCDWNKIPLEIQYPSSINKQIEKPAVLSKLLALAGELSKNIPFLRTDFYIINDRIYFGELTFYHGAGYEKFNPEKWDKIFGDWIILYI